MFKRARIFVYFLLVVALTGCANTNALPTLAAAPSHPNPASNMAPPVANETSKVLAAIAIERVTGQVTSPVGLDADR